MAGNRHSAIWLKLSWKKFEDIFQMRFISLIRVGFKLRNRAKSIVKRPSKSSRSQLINSEPLQQLSTASIVEYPSRDSYQLDRIARTRLTGVIKIYKRAFRFCPGYPLRRDIECSRLSGALERVSSFYVQGPYLHVRFVPFRFVWLCFVSPSGCYVESARTLRINGSISAMANDAFFSMFGILFYS